MLQKDTYQKDRMATAQLTRQKHSTKAWSSVFPAEQKTMQQSEVFVKKLLAVGLSSITYLRTIFPEMWMPGRSVPTPMYDIGKGSCVKLVKIAQSQDMENLAVNMKLENRETRKPPVVVSSRQWWVKNMQDQNSYHEQYLDGLKLKVLIDNSSCRSSNMVVSWMRSCFQAIEQKYLRLLTFAILNKDNHQEAYETYTYKFRYTGDGPVMSGPGTPDMAMLTKDTRQSTEKMLRTILLLTQSMKPLPKSICLSMKLGYYDDVTPKNYEPPSFAPIEEESYTFKSKPLTIKVGNVSTRFHAVKLYVCVEKTAYPTGENSPSELQVEKECQEEPEEIGDHRGTVVRSYNKYAIPLHSAYCASGSSSAAGNQDVPLTHSQKGDQLVPTQTLVSCGIESSHDDMALSIQEDEERPQSSTLNSEDFPVRCPCGVPYDHGLMVMCDICKKWQHGACFNVLEDSEVRDSHVCEECATPAQPCTDPTLSQQPELVTFCLFRRALVLLDQIKSRVTAASLAQQLGVDISMGNLLLKRLQSEKLVYTKKRINYVNRSKLLCEAFPKHLKGHGKPEESQQTVDISSQTPKSIADFDPDATPDLDVLALQKSITAQKGRCRTESLNISLDETVDIISLSQDVTVGTQDVLFSSKPCLEASQNDTQSEALATAGNTLLLLDSPPASQKTQKCFTSMPLHSGVDVEEGSAELLENQEPSEDSRAHQRKLSLGTRSKQGRGRPKRPLRRTMTFNDLEVSASQDSDIQMKNSISQDSEVSKKKKKTR